MNTNTTKTSRQAGNLTATAEQQRRIVASTHIVPESGAIVKWGALSTLLDCANELERLTGQLRLILEAMIPFSEPVILEGNDER